MDSKSLLGLEWQTLQNNHEQYEKSALLIKLSSLAFALAGLAASLPLVWLGLAVGLCWLLEGIYKTYQARMVERLLQVEILLQQVAPSAPAMQLYTQWTDNRPGGLSLIAGYARSALRPTVAYPYLPILLLGGLAKLLHWV